MKINRNLNLFKPTCPFGLSEIDSHFATVFVLNRGDLRYSIQFMFETSQFRLVVEQGNEGGSNEVYSSDYDSKTESVLNDPQIHEADDYQSMLISAFLHCLDEVEHQVYNETRR
jgi:hypothetical protein